MHLLLGDRAVLDPARHDEEIAFLQHHVTIAELDREASLEDEEEVIGVRVRMPDELALELPDLDLVVVVVADDPRLEVLVERRELLREIDRLVQGYWAVSICAFWSRPE